MSGQDTLMHSGQTACFSRAGLAEGTNANTIQISADNGNGIDYAIHGIAYHKATADNIAVTAHAVQAVSTSCLYLVQVDSAGTVSTKKGTEQLTASLGANLAIYWPSPDEDKCAIGGYKIATSASVTFTNGSTDLGATGITDTFYNFIGGLPNAPQTS